MSTAKPAKAPEGLGEAGKSLWHKVTAEFELSPAEGVLLEALCSAWDRHQQATAILNAEGLTVPGRFAPQQHPAVIIARDSAQLMRQLARQLRVELESDEARLVRPGPKPKRRIDAKKAAIAERQRERWGETGPDDGARAPSSDERAARAARSTG